MAWIVAGVRNQLVYRTIFSVIVVPKLSDDLTRFYRLFRITGSRFSRPLFPRLLTGLVICDLYER